MPEAKYNFSCEAVLVNLSLKDVIKIAPQLYEIFLPRHHMFLTTSVFQTFLCVAAAASFKYCPFALSFVFISLQNKNRAKSNKKDITKNGDHLVNIFVILRYASSISSYFPLLMMTTTTMKSNWYSFSISWRNGQWIFNTLQ